MSVNQDYSNKKLIIFDLDGTIAESKSAVDDEMLGLLAQLLQSRKVAIVSGGAFPQFQKQLLDRLPSPLVGLENLYCFPTNGTRAYHYDNEWHETYAEVLSEAERKSIIKALEDSFVATHYQHPEKHWGIFIEDRGTQVTFSALGQEAPAEEKKKLKAIWEQTSDPRVPMKEYLEKHIPNFEVRLNGMTSIDIMKQGIDKGYAIFQMEKRLAIPKTEMLFIGDAIYPGGNDYAAVKAGVDYVKVAGPGETKSIIRSLLGIT